MEFIELKFNELRKSKKSKPKFVFLKIDCTFAAQNDDSVAQ